jgi:hypothetical protein
MAGGIGADDGAGVLPLYQQLVVFQRQLKRTALDFSWDVFIKRRHLMGSPVGFL